MLKFDLMHTLQKAIAYFLILSKGIHERIRLIDYKKNYNILHFVQ